MLMLALACAPVDDAPRSGTLDVLSYNVHGLPPELTDDDTLARMALISPLLVDYDLVGVQEDWMADGHAALEAELDFDVREWFDTPLSAERVYGAGLDVYARAAKLDYAETHYADCHGTVDGAGDRFASKGFQRLRLDLGGGAELDWYNSHMEAGSGEADNAARAAHVDALIAAMNGDSAGRAVLFTGDTNLSGDDPVDAPERERWFAETGLVSACDEVDCPEPERIDLVLFRGGGGVQLAAEAWEVPSAFTYDGDLPLSDHDPIGARLGWTRDGD